MSEEAFHGDVISVAINVEAVLSAGTEKIPLPLSTRIPLFQSVGKVSQWDEGPDAVREDCEAIVNVWLNHQLDLGQLQDTLARVLMGLAVPASIMDGLTDD